MVVPPWYEIPPRGYGGLETICATLVDALVDRGHHVTLFGPGERSGTKARFVSTTETPQFRRLGETLPDVLHRARVHEQLDAGDFDVVHDHTMPGPLVAGQLGAPTVVTVHGSVEGELGDYYEAIGSRVRFVAISHDQRASRPDLPWIATVHHGLALADRVDVGQGDGPVVWLARFSQDKGPDLAVQACRAAGVPLLLAGKCNEPAEHRYLSDVIMPMVGEGVELMINPERASAMGALATARCLLLPITWREPFGMVLIEAMALGVPVVALRRGAVAEIVQHGVTGFVCDRPEELPDALGRIAEIDRHACVDRVRRCFSAAVMAERYEQVYLQAISDRSTVRSAWHRSASQIGVTHATGVRSTDPFVPRPLRDHAEPGNGRRHDVLRPRGSADQSGPKRNLRPDAP